MTVLTITEGEMLKTVLDAKFGRPLKDICVVDVAQSATSPVCGVPLVEIGWVKIGWVFDPSVGGGWTNVLSALMVRKKDAPFKFQISEPEARERVPV